MTGFYWINCQRNKLTFLLWSSRETRRTNMPKCREKVLLELECKESFHSVWHFKYNFSVPVVLNHNTFSISVRRTYPFHLKSLWFGSQFDSLLPDPTSKLGPDSSTSNFWNTDFCTPCQSLDVPNSQAHIEVSLLLLFSMTLY